jgi:beta-glucosidase
MEACVTQVFKIVYRFPKDFLWGTATSSHQVEGNNHLNDWWEWEQQPNRILLGHRSGDACGWWDGNWAKDFDLSASDGHKAHRLSIEWSRVEPHPALWDESALDYYRQILKGALDCGLLPIVTLHHFTSPNWLVEQGGWENPEVVPLFKRYVQKVVRALKDLVGMWVTINEPNVYVVMGYFFSTFPPGVQNPLRMFKTLKNMAIAHAHAYQEIHRIDPGSLVGVAHHVRGFLPRSSSNPLDQFICRLREKLFNQAFFQTLITGRMRTLTRTISLPETRGTQDYLGLNYYTTARVRFSLRHAKNFFAESSYSPHVGVSPTGFIANEPAGLFKALSEFRNYNLPIYITENGIEDEEDRLRPTYLIEHLMQTCKAANFNWQIKGYFYWSLVDNFEWDRGWTQRFGLYQLDLPTQKRIPRPSAGLYQEICTTNTISSDQMAQFAPELLDTLISARPREV